MKTKTVGRKKKTKFSEPIPLAKWFTKVVPRVRIEKEASGIGPVVERAQITLLLASLMSYLLGYMHAKRMSTFAPILSITFCGINPAWDSDSHTQRVWLEVLWEKTPHKASINLFDYALNGALKILGEELLPLPITHRIPGELKECSVGDGNYAPVIHKRMLEK